VRTVRFLHIPKTAGTSVNVFLDRFYPVSAIWVFRNSIPLQENIARLRSLDPEARRAIRLFRGHAPLVTGEADVDEARTFTLLREPVQRVKSFCCHIADGKMQDIFPPEKFHLGEFLDSGYDELENLQTKMLIGSEQYAALRREGSAAAFEAALDDAFDKIELTGTQDRYEETLLLATLVFGWPATDIRKKLNVRYRSNSVQFSEAETRKIKELNRWDSLAYKMAGSRFARVYERFSTKAEILKFRLDLRRAISVFAAKFKNLAVSGNEPKEVRP
jgi:hypothetical protein